MLLVLRLGASDPLLQSSLLAFVVSFHTVTELSRITFQIHDAPSGLHSRMSFGKTKSLTVNYCNC